ncbi:hypothetical protein [Sulfuricurvum sp.]|uniref:hypothetical protein n=1 Tax=Sulfuricurvum sp. TaxID=2025608 RepID=UPI002612F4A5|nr:hypothetical protein [Sulfuricurvum sp.]MDD2780167.1 hypothetical protein [Sulfuricurvum sp.]
MANILTLIILAVIGYWAMMIISRKKRELADKELLHREQFLKETQSLLKMEAPVTVDIAEQSPTLQPTSNTDFVQKVSDYFSAQGYSITQSPKAEGIDLIGVKEKELLLIRSDNVIKEVKKIDLQLFISECSVYIDNNPMLESRLLMRLYATNRPITEEAQRFVRENPVSLRLIEDI